MPLDRNKTPAAKARFARYRKRRRERLGVDADRKRQRVAANKSAAKHRAEIRDRKRNRNARNAAQLKKLGREIAHEDYVSGVRCVTENEIRNNRTHWTGPGMYREIELEAIADQLLREAAGK